MAPADLVAHQALVFLARGDGRTYRVLLFTGGAPAVATFAAGPEWAEPLAAFTGADLRRVVLFAIVASAPEGDFESLIDEVAIE